MKLKIVGLLGLLFFALAAHAAPNINVSCSPTFLPLIGQGNPIGASCTMTWSGIPPTTQNLIMVVFWQAELSTGSNTSADWFVSCCGQSFQQCTLAITAGPYGVVKGGPYSCGLMFYRYNTVIPPSGTVSASLQVELSPGQQLPPGNWNGSIGVQAFSW